jgi:hypothetical protein
MKLPRKRRESIEVEWSVWDLVEDIITTGYTLICFLGALGLLIGKFLYESFESYSVHFTNWNWTIMTLFYLCDLVSRVFGRSSDFKKIVQMVLFWVAYGTSWNVFWLVFVMFSDNEGVITELWIGNGGKYSMGFLINMNAVFHYLPAFSLSIYLFLNLDDVMDANLEIVRPHTSVIYKIVYGLFIVFMPLYFIGIYDLVLDIHQVYGITTHIALLILLAITISIVFNGFALLWVRIVYHRRRRLFIDGMEYEKEQS